MLDGFDLRRENSNPNKNGKRARSRKVRILI